MVRAVPTVQIEVGQQIQLAAVVGAVVGSAHGHDAQRIAAARRGSAGSGARSADRPRTRCNNVRRPRRAVRLRPPSTPLAAAKICAAGVFGRAAWRAGGAMGAFFDPPDAPFNGRTCLHRILSPMHPGYCPNCGERVTPYAAGCALCGADLDPKRWQKPVTARQRLSIRMPASLRRAIRGRRAVRVRGSW